MSFMSYVQFENTQIEFSKCVAILHEMADGVGDVLSASETTAAEEMIETVVDLLALIQQERGVDLSAAIDALTDNEATAFIGDLNAFVQARNDEFGDVNLSSEGGAR